MDDENKQNSNNNANTPAGEQGAKPRTRRRPRAAEEFRILHAPKNKRERRIAEIIRSRAEEKDFVELLRFVGDMLSLGKKLDAAQSEYESALSKLSKGSGNVLRQAQMLQELGVKNAKTIPQDLLNHEESTLVQLPKHPA
jgi:DNA anti-recombination protein RmuC